MKLQRRTIPVLIASAAYLIVLFFVQSHISLGPGQAHVDEVTYLNAPSSVCSLAFDVFQFLGKGYYCLVDALQANVLYIVLFQSLIYCVTSVFLYENLNRYSNSAAHHILLLIIVFDPYRAHLAIHVLKETFIILSLVVALNRAFLGFMCATCFRLFSIIYFIPLFRIKSLVIAALLLAIYFSFGETPLLEHFLSGGNDDMNFRDFDRIPTFNEFGLAGDVARGVLWPILLGSGAFSLISPTFWFLPISVTMLAISLFWVGCRFPLSFYIRILAGIGIFAFLAPGFTSFIRYSYPLILVVPLLLADRKSLEAATSGSVIKT
jgi:hypothetical protein